jgi:hypothetical protein
MGAMLVVLYYFLYGALALGRGVRGALPAGWLAALAFILVRGFSLTMPSWAAKPPSWLSKVEYGEVVLGLLALAMAGRILTNLMFGI